MKNTLIKLLLPLIILQLPYTAYAEFIFLKDGSILEGKILSGSGDTIAYTDKQGKVHNVENRKILRTLYTNLNMSKLYVQRRDGGSFVAFLVDEDRDTYRFRKELYKPEEFTVPRKDILFMSEKNPSALKGEALSGEITLSWLAPYGQVKVYKIYMKQKKDDEYKVIGTTKKTEITLTGLKTQTAYFFIVRAVDDTDYETNPSNEVQVITKSRLPEPPEVKAEKDAKENWVLMWTEAKDEDGRVEGYRIYSEKEGKYALLEETKKFTSVVPYDAIFDSIHVRSIDNNGDESEPDDYRHDWRFLLSPQYCIPVGKTSEFTGNGYGADLDISRREIFIKDFELGFTGGYTIFEGKKKIGKGNSDVTSLNIFPAALFTAYRIPFMFDMFNHYDIISFFPKISAGVLVMQMDYDLLDNTGAVEETKSAVILEPFIKAGIFAEFGVSRNLFFTIGGEFTYMIDSIQGLGMINLSASAGLRF